MTNLPPGHDPGPDPWTVLGVAKGASDDEIRAAYRKLAARHHPDRPGGDARRMSEINAALAAIRHPLPEVPRAAPVGAAATAVEGDGSSRPLGCAAVAAIAAVVLAATVAIAVAITAKDDAPTTDTASATARSASSPTTAAPAAGARGGPPEPPPWDEPALPRDASPLAVSQWQLSDAADACPLLVPIGADAGGTTRALQVDGGWGVSWGRPNEEELFGITGRLPSGRRGRPQPEAALSWTDGSTASLYRDGSRLVADLTIEGVDCRYGVFSTLGFEHLAEVLGALRFVRT